MLNQSQGLKAVITTGLKLLSSDHRLYILAKKNQIIGMIKVGPKTLFIRNEIGQISEIRPLCCLDFYVYEAIQRSGYGKVYA
jgi:alpha-tubulin N-acetyltransferase 1